MDKTHKQKVAEAKEMKENLWHHLDSCSLRNLSEDDKKSVKRFVWQSAQDSIRHAYAKGYETGRRRGFMEGLTENVTKLAKDLTEAQNKRAK